MINRIEIRPAVDGDRDFVAGLASSLLEFGSPAWEDADVLARGYQAVLSDAVTSRSPDAAVLIADDSDGAPLGFISLKVREDVTGVARGHVADLAVADDARRMGVGSALMEAGEAWARQRGFAVLSLDVWSTNERALAFYSDRGYGAESLCLIKAL